LGGVGETRKATFACQGRDDPEEALAAVERRVPFDLPERLRALRARVAPAAGDLRQVGGRVLDIDHTEAGGRAQPLVLARRHEEEVADRGPDRELLAVEDAGDDDRIGEEEPPNWAEQAGPVAEDAPTIAKMVDRVEAENCIEGAILERERLARVC